MQDLLDENFLHHIFPNCSSFDISLLATTCKKFYTLREQYPTTDAKAQKQCYLAARYGYINILVDLRNHGKFDDSSILGAIVGGHVSVLEWCESVRMIVLCSDVMQFLEKATAHGHVEILQWLRQKFKLLPSDFVRPGVDLLQKAAKHNHIHVFEWLTSMINLDDWVPYWRTIAYNGAKEFIVWWVETRGNLLSKIAKKDMLDAAVNGKQVELCKWALEQNASITTRAFSSAVRRGLLEIVKLFKLHGFTIGMDFYAVDLSAVEWSVCKSKESFDTVRWCIEQGYYQIRTIPANFIMYGQLDIVYTLLDMDCKPSPGAITSAIECANMELLQKLSFRPKVRGELLREALLLKSYDVFRWLMKLDGRIQPPDRVKLDRNIPVDVGIAVFNYGIPVDPSSLTVLVWFRRWKLVEWLFDNGKSSLSLVDAKELQQKAHDAYDARLLEMKREAEQRLPLPGLASPSYDQFLNCEEYARF